MNILRHLVTMIFDIKIDVIRCEPHCVNMFHVNLLHSQAVWLFDAWHIYVSHLVVNVFSEFSEYIHKYVNIYLGMLGVNLLCIFLPESSNAMWIKNGEILWKMSLDVSNFWTPFYHFNVPYRSLVANGFIFLQKRSYALKWVVLHQNLTRIVFRNEQRVIELQTKMLSMIIFKTLPNQ